MTLSNLPGPIDGALVSSALLRKDIYAAIKGDGVVTSSDLKVSASTPNGQSLRIAPGTGVILNGYQSVPNEVYVAANPSIHTVTAGDMPGSNPGTTYWLVCLVVGDPQVGYSQTGHPFMPSDFDETQANTFQYVRPVLLPCSSTTVKFSELGKNYPGLALARLALPASTTTVTDAMITDLRVVAGDNSTRRWNAVSTSTVTWTNAEGQKDVAGCSVVVNSTSTTDVFDVDLNCDVYVNGGVVNFTDLMIDGTGQGDSVISSGGGHINGHGMWTVTGLTPGPHTFKVTSFNYVGSVGSALHSAGSTKLRIRKG
jgi:hypothetical protein